MKFNEKLVRLRKIRGITQDEFASAVGVSRQAVYKWECGQSYPEVSKLLEIKLLFGISIDDLLDDSYEIAEPEKKRRKRAPKKTEETVASQKAEEEDVADAAVEVVSTSAEPAIVSIDESGEAEAVSELEAVADEPKEEVAEEAFAVEEPVATEEAAVAEEDSVEVEEVGEVDEQADESEPVVVEAPAANEEAVAPEKKGFFRRLFGRK